MTRVRDVCDLILRFQHLAPLLPFLLRFNVLRANVAGRIGHFLKSSPRISWWGLGVRSFLGSPSRSAVHLSGLCSLFFLPPGHLIVFIVVVVVLIIIIIVVAMSPRASTVWTPADDQTLMEERSHGRQWRVIQEIFPGKTANACRKRYGRLQQRRNQEELEGETFDLIAQEYMLSRLSMWDSFAKRVEQRLGRPVRWEKLETMV